MIRVCSWEFPGNYIIIPHRYRNSRELSVLFFHNKISKKSDLTSKTTLINQSYWIFICSGKYYRTLFDTINKHCLIKLSVYSLISSCNIYINSIIKNLKE